MDANGHLTFVCFGLDPVQGQIDTALNLVKKWLETCGYPNAAVHIWGQTTIKGFLNDFPTLRLKVNGCGSGPFEILESWKSHADMKPDTLSLGEKQKKIVEEMRLQLLINTEAVHLRVTGESGVGKTRLVLEALSDDRLHPIVIYSDKPNELESNYGFLNYFAMPDNKMEIILVLDECSPDNAARYWNRMQGLQKRARLVYYL